MRLKEEKQKAHARAKAIARGELVEEDEAEESQNDVSDGEENIEVDAEGIASLSAKTIHAKLKLEKRLPLEVTWWRTEREEEEAPVLFNHDLPNLLSVLEKADVILEVLDARDPLAFRSKHIEDIAAEKGKKILFVLNKIGEYFGVVSCASYPKLLLADRSPREAVAAWSERLRTEQPTLLFRSASAFLPEEQSSQNLPSTRKGKAKVPVDDALGAESIISCLCEWAKTKDDEKLTVAVVGLANVSGPSIALVFIFYDV
jgi:nuclear GTP-binding protein